MEISIVVPVYNITKNAIKHLPFVIKSLRSKYKDFELLFIIDTVVVNKQIQELVSFREKYAEINIIFLHKNYGQHFATLCGYYLAKGDFIACIDEDMTEHLIEISKTDEYRNFDVFYFYYNKNEMYKSSLRKLLSYTYLNIINKIVNLKKHSTFRIISKELRNRMLLEKHIFWNLDVMIFNNTKNIGSTSLYLSNISDKDTVYNYKKLSKMAFEIAYEHNTILMNILFALMPAFLFFLVFINFSVASILFILLFILLQGAFSLKRKNTDSTQNKILKALQY